MDAKPPVLEDEILFLLYARDHVAQLVYLRNQRSENVVKLSSRSILRAARRAAAC